MRLFVSVALFLVVGLNGSPAQAWPWTKSCGWIVRHKTADYTQFVKRFPREIKQLEATGNFPKKGIPSEAIFTAKSRQTGHQFYVVEARPADTIPIYYYVTDKPGTLTDAGYFQRVKMDRVEQISTGEGDLFDLSDGRTLDIEMIDEEPKAFATDEGLLGALLSATRKRAAGTELENLIEKYRDVLIQLFKHYEIDLESLKNENLFTVIGVRSERLLLLRSGKKPCRFFYFTPEASGDLARIDASFGQTFMRDDGTKFVISHSGGRPGIVVVPRVRASSPYGPNTGSECL